MPIRAVAGSGSSGSGDMLASVYDPTPVEGDAFDMANMVEAADAKVMTAAERARLATLGASYDKTLGSDHTYYGDLSSEAVGESVVFGDLLYFDWTAGEYKKAAKGAAGTTPVVAIALETKADGETCLLLRRGFIRDDTWEFTASVVLLGAAGAPTSTLSATPGDQIQRVGQAISADAMWFDPSPTVVEVPA